MSERHQPLTEITFSRRTLLASALGLTAEAALAACGDRSPNRRELFTEKPSWNYDFAELPDGPIDPEVWYARLGPNGSGTLQVNTNKPANVAVQDGRLRIRALRQSIEGYDFSSARIDTSKSMRFTYGRLEIDAQLAHGAGELDAFWMLAEHRDPRVPTDQPNPAASGEIDILEHPGKEGDVAHFNLHTYQSLKTQPNGLVQGRHTVDGCSTGLHTYGMDWGTDFIAWTIDDQEVGVYQKPQGAGPEEWPFDTPHYLIMQLTMGGNFAGPVDPAVSQWDTSVAAVRYYPLKYHS